MKTGLGGASHGGRLGTEGRCCAAGTGLESISPGIFNGKLISHNPLVLLMDNKHFIGELQGSPIARKSHFEAVS